MSVVIFYLCVYVCVFVCIWHVCVCMCILVCFHYCIVHMCMCVHDYNQTNITCKEATWKVNLIRCSCYSENLFWKFYLKLALNISKPHWSALKIIKNYKIYVLHSDSLFLQLPNGFILFILFLFILLIYIFFSIPLPNFLLPFNPLPLSPCSQLTQEFLSFSTVHVV